MEVLLEIAVGLGLSAAAGFRILIPFLVMSIAANTGHLTLAPEMAWMGSQTAIIAFAVAALLEVLVYFIPVVANFMDLIEVPAAAVAGAILTATVTSDLSPFLRWSLALIAGSTIAGGTGATLGLTRLGATAVAGPVGDVAVATAELGSSTILSILAIAVPVLVLVLLAVLFYLVLRRRAGRRTG